MYRRLGSRGQLSYSVPSRFCEIVVRGCTEDWGVGASSLTLSRLGFVRSLSGGVQKIGE